MEGINNEQIHTGSDLSEKDLFYLWGSGHATGAAGIRGGHAKTCEGHKSNAAVCCRLFSLGTCDLSRWTGRNQNLEHRWQRNQSAQGHLRFFSLPRNSKRLATVGSQASTLAIHVTGMGT